MPLTDILENKPHNINAEREFLSCILIEPTLYGITNIKQKHLFLPDHKKIYKAMNKVHKERKEISPMTIINALWEERSDMVYDITSHSMITSWFQDSEKIILEHYNRRVIIKWTQELLDLAQTQDCDVNNLLFKATELWSSVDDMEEPETLISWSLDTMMRFFDGKDQPVIVQDMWYDFLTAVLWWWRAWALYVVAWRTGQGKSTFALNLCIEALKRWVKCSFFSTEMPSHEIHTRFISRESRVESRKIERWRDDVSEAVFDTIVQLWKEPADCTIYDTFSTKDNLERLIVKEASLWSKIMFIDYIQQVRVNWQNRNLAIWDMTTMFKQLAIRYGIAIVWLSQVNRASQNWDSQEPQLKDLRDSGSIEQDADAVIMLHGYDPDWQPPSMWVYVKKNRHWELWMAHIPYDKRYFLFTNP